MVQAKEEEQPTKRAAEKGYTVLGCSMPGTAGGWGVAVLEGLGVGVHGCGAQGGSHSLHQPGYAQQTDLSSMPANNSLSILIKL